MKDIVVIAIKNNIRIYVVSTKNIMLELVERHNLWPVATQALSRCVSIIAILGQMQKKDSKVVSILNGNGPLGTIMAESDSKGNIRGYVANPAVDLTYNKNKKIDITHAIGKQGYLKVVKDLGMKEVFTTQVAIKDGEITNEFSHYFYQSEQIHTAIMSGAVLDNEKIILSSGSLMFQLLPGYQEEDIKEIEKLIKNINAVSNHLLEKTPERIIKDFIPKAKIISKNEIRFACSCDTNKMLGAIKALGNNEIKKLIKEKKCEIKCQYCSEVKEFNIEQLKKLL